MKDKLLFFLCLTLLFIAFSAPADAQEIRISAAASLTEAMKEILAGYQQQHPEVRLLPNFASSGSLAKQIGAGAPADIYISANPKWMQHLQQLELIAEATEKVIVKNRLVFVGIAAGVTTLADLPDLDRVAICSPKSSPAGRYAEQALQAAGVYRELQEQQKLILAKDVRQALIYAERGEVDGAFVYQTDALLAIQAKVLFAVPQELYPSVVYPAAMTTAGGKKGGVEKLFVYLFGDEAKQVFARYGFVIEK